MIDNLYCWHDDTIKVIKDVHVSILDFGFIHCDATYDVMKTSNGQLLFYEKHIERYVNSCKYFNFTPIENLQEIVSDLLEINKIQNAFVWVINWRGKPPTGNPRDMSGPEHRVVYVKPYYDISDNYVSLGLYTENKRTPDLTVPQKYKNFNWIELTKAQRYADENNFDSAIILDTNDNISEGPGFSICFVQNSVVYTPKENCLDSITIQIVENVCKQNNIEFVRTKLNKSIIYTMDECFICSTSGGITPVSKIEDSIVSNFEVTKKLIELYKEQK